MGGLILKYVTITTFASLDNLKWDNTSRGTIYTISTATDYDPEKHPGQNGCVEVIRYGTGSTLQRFTSGQSGFFVRRFLIGGGSVGKWTPWEKI